jgi:hypothetical protein
MGDAVSVQHRISDPVVGRLIDYKLLHDGNRDDPGAAENALGQFLDDFAATQPVGPRPLFDGALITPANSTMANNLVLLSLLETLVTLDVLPAPALPAVLLRARAAADAEHQPPAVHEQINQFSLILQWSLRQRGIEVDATKVTAWGRK